MSIFSSFFGGTQPTVSSELYSTGSNVVSLVTDGLSFIGHGLRTVYYTAATIANGGDQETLAGAVTNGIQVVGDLLRAAIDIGAAVAHIVNAVCIGVASYDLGVDAIESNANNGVDAQVALLHGETDAFSDACADSMFGNWF